MSWAAPAMRSNQTMGQVYLDDVWVLSCSAQAQMTSNCTSQTPHSSASDTVRLGPWLTSLCCLRTPVAVSPASPISVCWWQGRHLLPTIKQTDGTRRWLGGRLGIKVQSHFVLQERERDYENFHSILPKDGEKLFSASLFRKISFSLTNVIPGRKNFIQETGWKKSPEVSFMTFSICLVLL